VGRSKYHAISITEVWKNALMDIHAAVLLRAGPIKNPCLTH
jgi:hypothetical protein